MKKYKRFVIATLSLSILLILNNSLTFARTDEKKIESTKKEKYHKVFSGKRGTELCEAGFGFKVKDDDKNFKDYLRNNKDDEILLNLILFSFIDKVEGISDYLKEQICLLTLEESVHYRLQLYLNPGEDKKLNNTLTENKIEKIKKENLNITNIKKDFVSILEKIKDKLLKETSDLKTKLNKNNDKTFIDFQEEKILKETNNTKENNKQILTNKNELKKDGKESIKEKIIENDDIIKKCDEKIKKVKDVDESKFNKALQIVKFTFPFIFNNKKNNFCSCIKYKVVDKNNSLTNFEKNLHMTFIKYNLINYILKNKKKYGNIVSINNLLEMGVRFFDGEFKEHNSMLSFLNSRENLDKIRDVIKSSKFKKFLSSNSNLEGYKKFINYLVNKENTLKIQFKKALKKLKNTPRKNYDSIKNKTFEKIPLCVDLSPKKGDKRAKDNYSTDKIILENSIKSEEEVIKKLKDIEKNLTLDKIKNISKIFKLENVKVYYKG